MDADLDRVGVVSGASIYPFAWNIPLAARHQGFAGAMTTLAAAPIRSRLDPGVVVHLKARSRSILRPHYAERAGSQAISALPLHETQHRNANTDMEIGVQQWPT